MDLYSLLDAWVVQEISDSFSNMFWYNKFIIHTNTLNLIYTSVVRIRKVPRQESGSLSSQLWGCSSPPVVRIQRYPGKSHSLWYIAVRWSSKVDPRRPSSIMWLILTMVLYSWLVLQIGKSIHHLILLVMKLAHRLKRPYKGGFPTLLMSPFSYFILFIAMAALNSLLNFLYGEALSAWAANQQKCQSLLSYS